jgi:hypothetical protein
MLLIGLHSDAPQQCLSEVITLLCSRRLAQDVRWDRRRRRPQPLLRLPRQGGLPSTARLQKPCSACPAAAHTALYSTRRTSQNPAVKQVPGRLLLWSPARTHARPLPVPGVAGEPPIVAAALV